MIETIRQQNAAPTLRNFSQAGNGAAHFLQGILQGAEAVVDFKDPLFCQNFAVIEQFLQIDGVLFNIMIQVFQRNPQFDTDSDGVQQIELIFRIISVIRLCIDKSRFQDTDLVIIAQRFDAYVFQF